MRTNIPRPPIPTLVARRFLALFGCADAPFEPEAGADGSKPEPRASAEVELEAGLKCNPRSAAGYASGPARATTVVDRDGLPVEINTAARFLEMQAESAADGVHIHLVSAFRRMEQQAYLLRVGAPSTAAATAATSRRRPGTPTTRAAWPSTSTRAMGAFTRGRPAPPPPRLIPRPCRAPRARPSG